MKQIGYKVTRNHIRDYCGDNHELFDEACGLYIGATVDYLNGYPLSPFLCQKYLRYFGDDVDVIEVTPNAIICG